MTAVAARMSTSTMISAPPGLETDSTDTLLVVLPPGTSTGAARDLFRQYGDVAHIRSLPGAKKFNMVVAYYDVRAATRLQVALGPGQCKPAPQMGLRTVKLRGDVQLAEEHIQMISDVKHVTGDEDAYIVKVHDMRDVPHLQALGPPIPKGKGAAHQQASPSPSNRQQEQMMAAAVRPLATMAMPDSSKNQAVLLAGLPVPLCTGPCLRAIFEQAGLKSSIVRCQMRRTGDTMEVLVALTHGKAVEACIKHFHGRDWGNSEKPVTARAVNEAAQLLQGGQHFECLPKFGGWATRRKLSDDESTEVDTATPGCSFNSNPPETTCTGTTSAVCSFNSNPPDYPPDCSLAGPRSACSSFNSNPPEEIQKKEGGLDQAAGRGRLWAARGVPVAARKEPCSAEDV